MLMQLGFSYLLIYIAIGMVLIIPGLLLQFGKEKLSWKNTSAHLDQLAVIIPFRNERNNLEKLLRCFEDSEKLPFSVLFVNDHSQDDGYSFLQGHLNNELFKLLDLPHELNGKKEAIRYALKEVQSEFVLTLDADIAFSHTYFGYLEKLDWKELNILPVHMISNRFLGRLAELDHLLVNALNSCASGWKRPFIASGANLLFRRDSFEKYDRFELHKHIPSGDDTYLLRDFRNAQASIAVYTNPDISVKTCLPNTLNAFLAQRIRWAAKTGDVNDRLANGIVLVQGILSVTYVILLGWSFFQQNLSSILFIWAAKSLLDVLFFIPFFVRSKRILTLIWIPVFELIYPFYAITIALASLLVRPKWKGRTIRVR